MKKLILFIGLATAWGNVAVAQDCTGNRYHQPIFTNTVAVPNVQYGSNLAQDETTPVNLFLDIYYPDGDTDTDRPLVLLAHGGSFIGGNKTDLATQCQALAKMGYVAATMQYRLLSISPAVISNPGLEFQKEVVRAVHDMRAAIRFFRKSVAEDGNPYGINPDIIIVGGFSAGAILANHTTYFDAESKIPTDLIAYVAAQGGMEGNSGNSGFNSVPQMALSWCGAIADTTWIEAGDQPYVGVHNLDDNVVPNLSGQPNIGVSIPVTLYGDSLMYIRTLNVGVNSDYMSVPGNGHCDFPANSGEFVTNFMYDQLCVQGLSLASHPETVLFSIYPNPAAESFYIDIPANEWEWSVSVVNMLGQVIATEQITSGENRIQVRSSAFQPGIYLVKLNAPDGKEAMKKVVIR
ncbi:MAG: T9SS type A sorting domain-containing protein [Crocinitomicaceae bacterium]|nr:T9SS type A sorting domain-containing protein [Crocinitomicaceae bacterium]